jgi:hypothetical protein
MASEISNDTLSARASFTNVDENLKRTCPCDVCVKIRTAELPYECETAWELVRIHAQDARNKQKTIDKLKEELQSHYNNYQLMVATYLDTSKKYTELYDKYVALLEKCPGPCKRI